MTKYLVKLNKLFFGILILVIIARFLNEKLVSDSKIVVAILIMVLVNQGILVITIPKDEISANQPFFISRLIGIGRGLNPRNKIARLLTFVLVCVFIPILIFLLFC